MCDKLILTRYLFLFVKIKIFLFPPFYSYSMYLARRFFFVMSIIGTMLVSCIMREAVRRTGLRKDAGKLCLLRRKPVKTCDETAVK